MDPYKSGLPAVLLAMLLSARERKWTMMTTNIAPEGWAARWDKRVEDRLYRNSRQVILREATSYVR
jgi:hypothetical protein